MTAMFYILSSTFNLSSSPLCKQRDIQSGRYIVRIRPILLGVAAIAAIPASVAMAQVSPAPAPVQPAVPATPANTAAQPPFVIPFMRGGTSVNGDMEVMLDRIVAYAQANRQTGVVITGIANPAGSDSARASRARGMATSVRNYLRDRGIPESRSRTAAEGDAAVGAVNRVDVTFVPTRAR